MSFLTDVTGDHSHVNTITRNQTAEAKKIYEALPKESRELLFPRITKFMGNQDEDPIAWLKGIETFAATNNFDIMSTFDFLLDGDAKDLWLACKTRTKMDEKSTKDWFKLKFVKDRSFLRIIEDFSTISQKPEERFENFELRVTKAVKEIFESGLSVEEIVQQVIQRRVRSHELKKAFALKPDLNADVMRKLAENFEKNEDADEKPSINKLSYSQVAAANHRPIPKRMVTGSIKGRNYVRSPDRPIVSRPTPVVDDHETNHNTQYQRQIQRNPPSTSMKFIAKKLYNQSKGLPPPREEILKPGMCFCCGSMGHFRNNCPLKDCCLICGKSGHSFRSCRLIGKYHHRNDVRCIIDETVDRNDMDKICDEFNEVEHDVNYLNDEDSIVPISSVESRQ